MELFKRNIIHDELQISLDIVRKFIIDKGLILTGGMAIDLSLKMKNKDGIYDRNTVPDYDCVSKNHYKDACELAKILCERFSNRNKSKKEISVGVIPAMHVQSCRVRVNFEVVADITYVPTNLFEDIPFLVVPDGFDEAGMKIIHPLYQMIDQHHALSSPIENFPREVIFNRLKKDIKRFDLLFNLMKLNDLETDVSNESNSSNSENSNTSKYSENLIELSQTLDLGMIENIIGDDYILYDITAYNKITQTPHGENIHILTDSYDKVKEYLIHHKIEFSEYNRILDIIPMHLEFISESNNITYKIYNNINSKVCTTASPINLNGDRLESTGFGTTASPYKTVHPQNIFMTLLYKHCMERDLNEPIEKPSIYLNMYLNLYNFIKEKNPDILLPLFNVETPSLYGKYNKTDSYVLQNYELRKKLNIEQTEETEKYISYENVRIKPFYPSEDKNCEPTYENSEMTDENLNRMLLLPEYNRNGKKIK